MKNMKNRIACVVGVAFLLGSLVGAGQGAPQGTADSAAVDFDAAMKGLRFDPATVDGNLDTGSQGNGILDADEMALLSAILKNPSLDLRSSGGVDHRSVWAAFVQARQAAASDVRALLSTWPTAADVVAGYAMLGRKSFDSYNAMSSGFGAPMKSDYSLALQVGRYLSYDGDADGDGLSNLDEYRASMGRGRVAYIQAALDPAIKATASQAAAAQTPRSSQKTLGIVLYPGFEVLDVFGPVEMWAYIPDFRVITVAEQAGPVRSTQGISTIADYSFTTAPPLDIIMVPGGTGTRAQLLNPVFLDYLREQHKRTEWTTSVCTGSALLAKAGILKGHKATTNKAFFSLAVEQDPVDVEWIVKARWVEDGKILTSSGVSAGTDMALGLIAKIYGKDRAERLARSLEYVWNGDADNDPFAIGAVPKSAGR